jgi:hypothetical protein
MMHIASISKPRAKTNLFAKFVLNPSLTYFRIGRSNEKPLGHRFYKKKIAGRVLGDTAPVRQFVALRLALV